MSLLYIKANFIISLNAGNDLDAAKPEGCG